ncbi:MAG: DUF6702 family protein [Flavobacteriaceae bacterium]
MIVLKKSFLILLLPLLAFTGIHKFYLSVTNINYSDKDKALQITTRIFIDDMDKLLEERYEVVAQLATANESALADTYIEKYLKSKLALEINGEERPYSFLGKEYDNDMMVCYMEIEGVDLKDVKSIQVRNEVLTDIFDDQQNVVHFRIKNLKKSFVLIKSESKGMLNL